MFRGASNVRGLVVAVCCVIGASSLAVAGDDASRAAASSNLVSAAIPLAASAAANPVASADERERPCRPIRRLGGKVRIARRGADCED